MALLHKYILVFNLYTFTLSNFSGFNGCIQFDNLLSMSQVCLKLYAFTSLVLRIKGKVRFMNQAYSLCFKSSLSLTY